MKKIVHVLLFALILLPSVQAWASQDTEAESLMQWQLSAIAENNRSNFISKGNRAFKEMMGDFIFDSFVMQNGFRLKNGFSLHYLGSIKRLGMVEHVWRITATDYKYELLGTLSIAKGMVVGFKLE